MAGWCSQSSTHMPDPPPKHVQQCSGPPINTRAILLRGGLRRATGAGGRSGGAHACARAQRAGLRAGEVCRDQRQRDERPGAHERAPLAVGAAWTAHDTNVGARVSIVVGDLAAAVARHQVGVSSSFLARCGRADELYNRCEQRELRTEPSATTISRPSQLVELVASAKPPSSV